MGIARKVGLPPPTPGGRRGTPHAAASRAALVALGLLASLASGCARVHGVVRHEEAPLFADPSRATVLARLEKLAEVAVPGGVPGSEALVRVRAGGRQGYMARGDLSLFRFRDEGERRSLLHRARRGVVLEEKDWPPHLTNAILDDRVQVGMTPEMVELAWGFPDQARRFGDEQEWIYDQRTYELRVVRTYDPWVGYSLSYGGRRGGTCGGLYVSVPLFPTYSYERVYVPTVRRRTVRFENGRVIAWD